jgi:hypothetical protein
MHRIDSAGFSHHFDLPAGDGAIAQDADASIIERMPFPPNVGRLEDREFFFWQEM